MYPALALPPLPAYAEEESVKRASRERQESVKRALRERGENLKRRITARLSRDAQAVAEAREHAMYELVTLDDALSTLELETKR
jgi:hypothetical protein